MKKSLPIIVISFALAAAGGAWFYFSNNTRSDQTTNSTSTTSTSTAPATTSSTNTSPRAGTAATDQTISRAELAKNNGKNGNKCWVAVNGTVYDVTNAREWRNGQHSPSDGEAFCGADMSNVIGKAPHSNSVLAQLPVAGQLQ